MFEGMTLARAILTAQTCGEACWEAREDVCRCSCGGANHGILRTANGIQPVRSRKLQGFMYHLLAVESANGGCRAESMEPIDDQARSVIEAAENAGRWRHSYCTLPGEPIKVKSANESEVNRWPELAAWRGRRSRPIVSWIRSDFRDLAGTPVLTRQDRLAKLGIR